MPTRSIRQREEALNVKLGELLAARYSSWYDNDVRSEGLGEIRDSDARIDVLVDNPLGRPVAVEAKYDGANVGTALRKQVESRIGSIIDATGEEIEAGISVVYPAGTTNTVLHGATLRYAIHELTADDSVRRWPENDNDWIKGSVDDLADAIEIVSLSEKRIREGERVLSNGIRDASSRLEKQRKQSQFSTNLAGVLHQDEGEQTTRMAVAIIVNAFVFHYAIEEQSAIPNVEEGLQGNGFRKMKVMKTWDAVLDVNYWPIFSIARDILEAIPTKYAHPLLDQANDVAEQLVTVGATTFHDLAARMFQTLISDRKLLATFYTLPESACLLAELAVSQMDIDWTDQEAIQSLKIADFACGTGTLLSATQRAIYRRIRRAGFNDKHFHRTFMENVLLGTDIMPSAAHLSASMLSSAHPQVGYDESLVRVLPYGIDKELSKQRQVDEATPYIGALDLRLGEFGHSLFTEQGMGHQVEIGGRRMTGKAKLAESGRDFPVEHESFDLVIMNPPFTRPTGHEAKKVGVPVPSFAGFDTTKDEQLAMSRKLKAQSKAFGHGNAGLASDFMDLAHDKVKPGGVLALVLPFSFVSGMAWSKARESLSLHYQRIHIVSIAAAGNSTDSFSADTGMAECLVLATKAKRRRRGASPPAAVRFANLERRPRTLLEAHESAKEIGRGAVLKGTFRDSGAAGIQDADVGKVMMALQNGRLSLPRIKQSYALPMTEMKNVAQRGLYHMDIYGTAPRGAFDIRPLPKKGIPSYPALWNHHASKGDGTRERRFVVKPDTEGIVRKGLAQKANKTWNTTASRLHHNLDFRLNSQSLALCLTQDPTLGGTAWPNLIPCKKRYEIPLLLWGNTTLGMMVFWWCSVREQAGRARMKITAIPSLPTLDTRKLKKKQLKSFKKLFEDFGGRAFLAANEAYRDDARKELDRAVLRILGLPKDVWNSLDLIRMKWCAEPSVHGGKNTKPDV